MDKGYRDTSMFLGPDIPMPEDVGILWGTYTTDSGARFLVDFVVVFYEKKNVSVVGEPGGFHFTIEPKGRSGPVTFDDIAPIVDRVAKYLRNN